MSHGDCPMELVRSAIKTGRLAKKRVTAVLVRVVRDLIAWDNARLADLERQLRREREAKTGQPAAS